ncbi:MAG: RagB/SusD family nutrient uptake outer membrane protein [Bacteroidaceae bacterium]|nr:RagB/SusD family nutrient uptake outer membrane protein [Bacteroidaceae bacterium]
MQFNKLYTYLAAGLIAMSSVTTSCMKDLERDPIDPNIDTKLDPAGLYRKCYAGLIMEGNDGSADFTIDDAGKSTLLRNLFNFNELSTDEAICWWSDGGIVELGYNQYSPGDATLRFLYYRLWSNITYCNEYLNNEICINYDATKLAEIRFVRAYNYYLLADFFGNIPFLDHISTTPGEQKDRKFMFQWIENELLTAEKDMLEAQPKTDSDANYGRADKAAAWLMLSRLYLNAGVWINEDGANNPYWEQAATYAQKVIEKYPLFKGSNNGYTAYDMLFMADNGNSGASQEAVLPLLQDGKVTKGWGGSKFFVAAMWNSTMFNVQGKSAGTTSNNWSGIRCRPDLIKKFFGDPTIVVGKSSEEIRAVSTDDRAIFWGMGDDKGERTLELGDNSSFYQGITTTKWSNQRSDGKDTHDSDDLDTDFFLLRSAEAYLNYAEAKLRLNQMSEAVAKLDEIRSRAHARSLGSSITLNDILDERSREFYFEGLRRPDLIRFGQYGGAQATYKWTYKGGAYNGVNFKKEFDIFPIPQSEIDAANGALKQNPGY